MYAWQRLDNSNSCTGCCGARWPGGSLSNGSGQAEGGAQGARRRPLLQLLPLALALLRGVRRVQALPLHEVEHGRAALAGAQLQLRQQPVPLCGHQLQLLPQAKHLLLLAPQRALQALHLRMRRHGVGVRKVQVARSAVGARGRRAGGGGAAARAAAHAAARGAAAAHCQGGPQVVAKQAGGGGDDRVGEPALATSVCGVVAVAACWLRKVDRMRTAVRTATRKTAKRGKGAGKRVRGLMRGRSGAVLKGRVGGLPAGRA